jgi:hypothetical protein
MAALILSAALVLGPGVLSPADAGVLERVAERRSTNGWGLAPGTDWRVYDVLVAPADCEHLGRTGWLITRRARYRALVVDCESGEHAGQMRARGLLADVNRAELGHQMAVLVLDR